MFWIPTKPTSLEDTLRRARVSNGTFSAGMAQGSSIGHCLTLVWNDYRQWYVGEYYWGERVVLVRSRSLAEALPTMVEAYDRGAPGTSLHVCPRTDKIEVLNKEGVVTKVETRFEADWELAAAHPRLQVYTKEIEKALEDTWRTWKHRVVGEALVWEKNMGVPVQLMLDAESPEDWETKRTAFLDARKALRRSR